MFVNIRIKNSTADKKQLLKGEQDGDYRSNTFSL